MMQSPESFVAGLEGKPLAAHAELMARRAPEFSREEDLYPLEPGRRSSRLIREDISTWHQHHYALAHHSAHCFRWILRARHERRGRIHMRLSLVSAMVEFGLCLLELAQGGGCMSGFSSAFPSFCELVATWLGGGGQAYTMDYQGRSHTRFDSGHRHLSLPRPAPLNSVALPGSDEST